MLPDILIKEMRGFIEERLAPTPYAAGMILPVSNYGQTVFSPGYMKTRRTIVSNYKVADFTPFTGDKVNSGTTTILDNPRLFKWNNKAWDNITETPPAVIESCRTIHNWDIFREIAKSADEGWNAFIENTAVYGITGDQIPGLLNGSGIPQAIETANFYNGSLNGSQMVDLIVDWAGAVRRNSGYRYKTSVLAISPKLHQQLNKTTFAIVGSTTSYSVLQVLQERLQFLDPNYRIVEAPANETGKFMAFLPYDPELVGLGVVNLKQYVRYGGEKIEYVGSTLGVVAEQPESSLIVRTPNS